MTPVGTVTVTAGKVVVPPGITTVVTTMLVVAVVTKPVGAARVCVTVAVVVLAQPKAITDTPKSITQITAMNFLFK
jgi:hypothetical protein